MNQSVISRMDLIYDMEAPDLNTMVKRVMNVTGFTDEQEATKMAIVVRDVAERCRQTMITDGSCGMREFKSWVLSTMVTHDPYESALSTIISSASADPDRIVDRPPCSRCLHRNKMTVEEPCYSCIDLMDLSLHRPNVETEFASFTPATEVDHEE